MLTSSQLTKPSNPSHAAGGDQVGYDRQFLPPGMRKFPRWFLVLLACVFSVPLHLLAGLAGGFRNGWREILIMYRIDD